MADTLRLLQDILQGMPEVEFAMLFGSHARQEAHKGSDWDIALWLTPKNKLDRLSTMEEIRFQLRKRLNAEDNGIDIVDLKSAALSICNTVVSEGKVLVGEETLAYSRFCKQVWSRVEEFEWRRLHES